MAGLRLDAFSIVYILHCTGAFLIHVQTSQMHCDLQMAFPKMHFNHPAALLSVFVVSILGSSYPRVLEGVGFRAPL